jgi:hypothetical protein
MSDLQGLPSTSRISAVDSHDMKTLDKVSTAQAGPRTQWPTTQAAMETARGQGLRLPGLPQGTALRRLIKLDLLADNNPY